MEGIQNILVPTDFSANSVSAFRYAVSVAKKHEAIIHLLHCIEPIPGIKFNYSDDHGLIQEGIERLQKDMKKFINSIPEPNLTIKEVIRTGKAYDQILSYSRDSGISLIVLATNDWSGEANLMPGKVTEKVTRYSKIPVVLITNNDLATGENFSPVIWNSLTQ
jgi:nucleotide-binding universal stress UspA family protein